MSLCDECVEEELIAGDGVEGRKELRLKEEVLAITCLQCTFCLLAILLLLSCPLGSNQRLSASTTAFTSFGEISEEDIEILVRTADQDGDGKVSLEDFRAMLSIQSVEDAEAAEEYEGGDAAAMYGDSAAAASALAETEVPEAE